MELVVSAGIVTYNPDLRLLMQNIQSVMPQVDWLIVCDNGSENVVQIEECLNEMRSSRMLLIKNEENRGIAFALNRIMQKSLELKASWTITLDQDSIVPQDLVASNREAMMAGKDLAIISCVIHDRNEIHRQPERDERVKYSEIETCITSASLTNVEAWRKLGGFDELMFIDNVDIEYCLRARRAGYRILRNNTVVLSHAIGNIKEKKLLGRWLTVRIHSPMRKYYQIRNILYMHYKLYGRLSMEVLYRVLAAYFKVIFYEQDKARKIHEMNRGILDGFKYGRKARANR